MAWKVELSQEADRQLDKLDPQIARRILKFLHQRVASLDNPRSIGETLHGSKLGEFWRSIASATIASSALSRTSWCSSSCCASGTGVRFMNDDRR